MIDMLRERSAQPPGDDAAEPSSSIKTNDQSAPPLRFGGRLHRTSENDDDL